jgi:vancomycin resistance protein YoaR
MGSVGDSARGLKRPGARRWIAVALLLSGTAGGAAAGARSVLPAEGEVARGVLINGAGVEGGTDARAAARDAAARLLDQRLSLRWDGAGVLEVTPRELGATVDEEALARHLDGVGRRGDVFARVDEALSARRGEVSVWAPARVPVEELAERLSRLKEERDTAPRASKLDFEAKVATPHAPGRYLDLYGAAAAIERALEGGGGAVDLPVLTIAPRASSEVVAAIDVSQVVAKFETRFGYLGGQAGRAQNIERAASSVNGVVLMPGEVVSFNENVGPRSIENGFAHAPEIYKGEMREGIGGGTCQVASTLHAAAFMGGVDIVERINHSRPSGYIRMGLDATVVYPTVDLKLRNPYEFPIVLRASINKGLLAFEIRGRERPVTVEFAAATTGVEDFKRKIEEDARLPAGRIVLKQKGIRGATVKKIRTIHGRDGKDRVEVSTDVYPPTFEIYRVPPGTDVETELPPLPSEEKAKEKDGEKPGGEQKAVASEGASPPAGGAAAPVANASGPS